jgi:hypothetical protein
MERYCSTGQSPRRAVAPMKEEEDEEVKDNDKFKALLIIYLFLLSHSLKMALSKPKHVDMLY